MLRKVSKVEVKHNICKSKAAAVSAQLAFTCSKLTIETLEQAVKYVQS